MSALTAMDESTLPRVKQMAVKPDRQFASNTAFRYGGTLQRGI